MAKSEVQSELPVESTKDLRPSCTHDLPVDAEGRAAIHDSRLVQFTRDTAEELHHQEDEESVRREVLRHDQRQRGVHPAHFQKQDILRDEHDVIGQHQGAEHQREPEIAPAEPKPCKGERGERTADHIADGGQHRDEERVPEELPETHLQPGPAANISADIDRRGNERGRTKQLILRPERT
ncbi:hypothetical protein SOVF_183990 [Spinacia oleracea]|nr:hypothetical protein SOVF_183990 [Spinacia oleracea]